MIKTIEHMIKKELAASVITYMMIFPLISDFCSAETIIVSSSRYPTSRSSPDAIRIQLDDVEKIEHSLSRNLLSDTTFVVQLSQDSPNARQHQELINAYQGATDAWSLGVMKVPAIVVDRKYVIYGETDVLRAIDRIAEYRRAIP